MRWAFGRREQDDADGRPPSRRSADDEGDPAAELRARTRRRLIGAAALLLAAVIVVPMLLDSAPRPVPDSVRITVANESAPAAPLAVLPAADEQKPSVVPPETVPLAPPPPPSTSAAMPPATPAAKLPPAAAPSAIAAAPKAAEVPRTAAGQGEQFALQVAALSSATAAKDLVARLKQGGFPAYTESVATADGTRHRVRVGRFANREEAQRIRERMRAAGYTASLVGA